MHLTFRGVFLSLIQKHFPSTKRKREKGTGIKRKRKSTLHCPASDLLPCCFTPATQLFLFLFPFSLLHAFCYSALVSVCPPAHLPSPSLIWRTAALGHSPFLPSNPLPCHSGGPLLHHLPSSSAPLPPPRPCRAWWADCTPVLPAPLKPSCSKGGFSTSPYL